MAVYDGKQKNPALEIEDWGDGKLAGFRREKHVGCSIIEEKGLGNKPTSSRKFHWTEDPETESIMTPSAVSGTELTIPEGQSKYILKDDVFFNEATGKTFRVTETPGENKTALKVVEITDSGTEITPDGNAFLTKDFMKVYTSKPEGSKDRDGLVYNPEDHYNVVGVFEDNAETADVTANEPWQLSEYTHREYQKIKQLDKHKGDINNGIYIGKYFQHETRMFTKGITNFNNIQIQTGDAFEADGKTLKFKIEDYDLFMANKVRRYSDADEFITLCNDGYLIWVNALVRSCASLTYNPTAETDQFGYKIRKLVHQLCDLNLVVDPKLNKLYAGYAFGLNLEINKVGLRHFADFNTKIKLGCQNASEHVLLDQIYTIGGGVQLIKAQNHSLLKLKMKAA